MPVEILVTCQGCGHTAAASPVELTCARCGNWYEPDVATLQPYSPSQIHDGFWKFRHWLPVDDPVSLGEPQMPLVRIICGGAEI